MSVNKKALREKMIGAFKDADLKLLCSDLGVDYESISGDTKPIKVLELIEYMARRNRLEELATACVNQLPEFDWGMGTPVASATSTTNVTARQTRDDATQSSEPIGAIRNRYALVIGINQFNDPAFAELKFCVSDAKALSGRLEQLGYTVVTMTDDLGWRDPRFPSYNNIEAELNRLITSAAREDLLLLHFSCHGTLVEGKPFLIVSDTRQSTLQKTAIAVGDIEAQLKAGKSKRRVIFLDACHVGAALGRSEPDRDFIKNVHDLAWGSSMLAASTSEQVALEMNAQQHGAFTNFLLKGLSGDGTAKTPDNFVTVGSLKDYVLNEVTKWSLKNNVPLQQPTFKGEGLGDMVLADLR